MTQIYTAQFARTLDTLLETYASSTDTPVEAWTFDDKKTRQEYEQKFAALGVTARLRTAYKPLVHFFLEDANLAGIKTVKITYPVKKIAAQNRFLLETYPLTTLFRAIKFIFIAGNDSDHYAVEMISADETTQTVKVLAPNRVHADYTGSKTISPTGWLRVGDYSKRLETDYEALFHSTMAAIKSNDWSAEEPYFEELNISVSLPIADEPLPYEDEVISLREALHEEFYFSLLEVFQIKSGRPVGDRGLQPGQIVPEIKYDDVFSVTVQTVPLSAEDYSGAPQDLDTATQALTPPQFPVLLEQLGGTAYTATAQSGRTVHARHINGSDKPMMISAGQHANETTGPIGALRAALELKKNASAHFTISPLENPDGYALHQRLIGENPRHMHHAARYTALGDDLEYRKDKFLNEKQIRFSAVEKTNAMLHVNLHGYPAHEWTRPLSGYIPRGFAMWTLPKGFFLILRFKEKFEKQAREILEHVTAHLAEVEGLVAFNKQQIWLYEKHAGETGFEMVNGFPCMVSQVEDQLVPITLITEYPDETIYDEAFIKGHTAQMETVLAAYTALQKL